jgi:hypothetical protein
MSEVLPEGESIHRICQHVTNDEYPRKAAGKPICIDLSEKGECSAPFVVMNGEFNIAIPAASAMSPAAAKLSHAHTPAIPTTTPSVEKIPPPTIQPTAIDHIALKPSFDFG